MKQDLMKRITIDDRICNGRPIIRGLRITVSTILEFLLAGTPEGEILEQYPSLEKEDIEACRLFAISLAGNGFSFHSFAA